MLFGVNVCVCVLNFVSFACFSSYVSTSNTKTPNFLGHLINTAHFPSFLVAPCTFIHHTKLASHSLVRSWSKTKVSRRIICWRYVHVLRTLYISLQCKRENGFLYGRFSVHSKLSQRCIAIVTLQRATDERNGDKTENSDEDKQLDTMIKQSKNNRNVIKMNYPTLRIDLSCWTYENVMNNRTFCNAKSSSGVVKGTSNESECGIRIESERRWTKTKDQRNIDQNFTWRNNT